MGMFDDIRVPVTLLKTCLKAKQFEVIKGTGKKYFFAQTKSFDALMDTYLVKWKRLYKRKGDEKIFEPLDIKVNLYNQVIDNKHNKHWFEFNILFKKGKVKKISLVGHRILTKEEAEKERQKSIEIINYAAKRKATSKNKVFRFFARLFEKISSCFSCKSK